MKLLSLPPDAPELNPVEYIWDELREKFFHNKAFNSIDALEDQLQIGLLALENDQPRVHSIVAWDWIVNAYMIAMGAATATSAGVAALCGWRAHSVADWLGATLRN